MKLKNNSKENSESLIIDATNGILGRVASFAAKQALLGKKVIIVNCDNALLTGRRRMIIEQYHEAHIRGGKSLNGPHFPKHSDRIMKRTVRGMLNYNQQRGLDALKRIICHNKVPKEYEAAKKMELIDVKRSKTLLLSDLSKEI